MDDDFCTWRVDDNPYCIAWETGCGNTFEFEAGDPASNHFKHCPYCGGQLQQSNQPVGAEEE